MEKIIIYNRDIEKKFYKNNEVSISIKMDTLIVKYFTLKVEYLLPKYVFFKDHYNRSFYSTEKYMEFLHYIECKIEETKELYNKLGFNN